jgi:hypothetical protein
MHRGEMMASRRFLMKMLVAAVILSACGGGDASLAEYADEVEVAVAVMRTRILATDDALRQPVATVEEMEAIWRERAAAREEFLDALELIEPPDEAEGLHAVATDILRRLAEAEGGVADEVRDHEDLSQLDGLGSTAAFRRFITANEKATDVCLAAQGMFDDTKRREILEDVPWMAEELTTVIEVVFDCVPGES